MAVLLSTFVKVFGTIGPSLFSYLSKRENKDNFSKIVKLFNQGNDLRESVKEVLGSKYEEIINKSKSINNFIYETDENDYVTIKIKKNSPQIEKIDLLRSEFNANIREIKVIDKEDELHSHAKMVIRNWIKRYGEVLGYDNEEERKKVESAYDLLDPNVKSFRDLYNLMKPVFGITGALTVVYAVMLFTGVGLGVFAQIAIWIAGVPGGQVVAAVLLSSILFALASIRLGVETKIQSVINIIYKVLDSRERSVRGEFEEESDREGLVAELENFIERDIENDNIDKSTMLSIIGILKYLSAIDGEIHDREVAVYKVYMEKNFVVDSQTVDDLWEYVPAIKNIDSISYFKDVLNEKQKKKLYKALKYIAVADKKIHVNERKALKKIKDMLDL